MHPFLSFWIGKITSGLVTVAFFLIFLKSAWEIFEMKNDIIQEFSAESKVAEFCSTEYGVEFPMFATAKVTGKKAHPFYKKLKKLNILKQTFNTR